MTPGIVFARGRNSSGGEDRFDLEVHVAASLGLPTAQVDLDELLLGDAERAVAHLQRRPWVYRGWLLDHEDYSVLAEAVEGRGAWLTTTPDQLAEAAYLPRWAPLLGDRTPASIWTEDDDADEAWEIALEELGPPPWVIKDHLKSGRPHWHRACFVPKGADREDFGRVVEGLLAVRGDLFCGGLVVRRFVELATLPYATEGRDVPDEHRIVFWQGDPVAWAPYSDVEAEPVDGRAFRWLGDVVDSPFFTADVARLASGGWTVIELNDGGCSALPPQLDPWRLYEAIAAS